MGKNLRKIVSLLWPKRRWCQFSLATMLFVVTVFCVWLGWAVDRATRQRAAVRALLARDAIVTYDSPSSLDVHPRADEPRLRQVLREKLGDDYFCRATHVDFLTKKSRFDEEAIAALKRLPVLSNLFVMRKPITGTHIRAFARLNKLKSLSLVSCALQAEAVGEFSALKNLEVLSVSGKNVPHGAVEQILELANLRGVSQRILIEDTHTSLTAFVEVRHRPSFRSRREVGADAAARSCGRCPRWCGHWGTVPTIQA